MAKIKDQLTGNTIELEDAVMLIDQRNGDALFTAMSNPEQPPHSYAVYMSDLNSPTAVINKLSHLKDKPWFKADKFFAAVRGVTGSGGFL